LINQTGFLMTQWKMAQFAEGSISRRAMGFGHCGFHGGASFRPSHVCSGSRSRPCFQAKTRFNEPFAPMGPGKGTWQEAAGAVSIPTVRAVTIPWRRNTPDVHPACAHGGNCSRIKPHRGPTPSTWDVPATGTLG